MMGICVGVYVKCIWAEMLGNVRGIWLKGICEGYFCVCGGASEVYLCEGVCEGCLYGGVCEGYLCGDKREEY